MVIGGMVNEAINVVTTGVGVGIGAATDKAFEIADAAKTDLASVGNAALKKAVNFFTGWPAALAGVLDIGMDDSGGLGAGLGEG
jgi:hypothetical protein